MFFLLAFVKTNTNANTATMCVWGEWGLQSACVLLFIHGVATTTTVNICNRPQCLACLIMDIRRGKTSDQNPN